MSSLPRAKQFYFTHEKKDIFFFRNSHNFLCVRFILTPVLKYSRQRLLLFFNHKLTCTFSGKSSATIGSVSFYSFFSFCYRLVRTYVREHISVFNKNDRRNLFLSAHIILVWACFWRNIQTDENFAALWYEQHFGKYVQAIKLIKTISFVCLLASYFSHKILRVQKFCQKAIKQHRL